MFNCANSFLRLKKYLSRFEGIPNGRFGMLTPVNFYISLYKYNFFSAPIYTNYFEHTNFFSVHIYTSYFKYTNYLSVPIYISYPEYTKSSSEPNYTNH